MLLYYRKYYTIIHKLEISVAILRAAIEHKVKALLPGAHDYEKH